MFGRMRQRRDRKTKKPSAPAEQIALSTGGRRLAIFLRATACLRSDYFQPGAGRDHQQFQGVRIQLPAVTAVGVNQRCYFVFEGQRQHQHLLVGRTTDLLCEPAAHLRDIARRRHAISGKRAPLVRLSDRAKNP
jgi:hypothetical protein